MEGYIKLNIGGSERALKFDIKSTGWIIKQLGCSLSDIQKALENPFESYPAILYFGAKRAAEVDRKAFEHEYDDVYEWIGEEGKGILSDPVLKAVKAFCDTLISILPADPNVKPQSKSKKSTGK